MPHEETIRVPTSSISNSNVNLDFQFGVFNSSMKRPTLHLRSVYDMKLKHKHRQHVRVDDYRRRNQSGRVTVMYFTDQSLTL